MSTSACDEGVVCAFKSPFGGGFVKLKVDDSLTVSQLHEAERVAKKFSMLLLGSDEDTVVPEEVSEFPMNAVGRAAIKLISNTIPSDLINLKMFKSLAGATVFFEQLVNRVENGHMMPREGFVGKLVELADKFGPTFVDIMCMQLSNFEERPKDYLKPDYTAGLLAPKAKRLVKLAKLAKKTLLGLQDIMGLDKYVTWKAGVGASAKAQAEKEKDDIKVGKNGKRIKALAFDLAKKDETTVRAKPKEKKEEVDEDEEDEEDEESVDSQEYEDQSQEEDEDTSQEEEDEESD